MSAFSSPRYTTLDFDEFMRFLQNYEVGLCLMNEGTLVCQYHMAHVCLCFCHYLSMQFYPYCTYHISSPADLMDTKPIHRAQTQNMDRITRPCCKNCRKSYVSFLNMITLHNLKKKHVNFQLFEHVHFLSEGSSVVKKKIPLGRWTGQPSQSKKK